MGINLLIMQSNGAKTIIYDKKFEGFKNGILYLSFKNVRKIFAEISYKIFNPKINNLNCSNRYKWKIFNL